MAYEMKCPLCGKEMTVDVETETEANELILAEGIKHVEETHKDLPMDKDMLKQLIHTNMRKI